MPRLARSPRPYQDGRAPRAAGRRGLEGDWGSRGRQQGSTGVKASCMTKSYSRIGRLGCFTGLGFSTRTPATAERFDGPPSPNKLVDSSTECSRRRHSGSFVVWWFAVSCGVGGGVGGCCLIWVDAPMWWGVYGGGKRRRVSVQPAIRRRGLCGGIGCTTTPGCRCRYETMSRPRTGALATGERIGGTPRPEQQGSQPIRAPGMRI